MFVRSTFVAGIATVLALAATWALPAAARAQTVTLAARVCPGYAAITANLARNDLQESLEDLGPDTLYRSGEPVSAEKEAAGQAQCTPITGWSFAFGRGRQSRAVLGAWGALARITDPFPRTITTLASTPLLDATGADTGRTLAGAVTVGLSAAELAAASRRALWVQGGLPADPVLAARFPGGYAFGALRCAVDNLNGDNVEYAAFPAGVRHVLCFAYYVKPPPPSGRIVIRKELDAPAGSARQTVAFTGDLTYNANDTFTLDAAPGAPGSQTFYRAATADPWTVRETAAPRYPLTALGCDSATGASQVTADVATGAARIVLGPADTVTCTYRNTFVPPPAGILTLGKTTFGAVGTTRFSVTGTAGSSTTTVTTTDEGVPAYASPDPLPAGDYTVAEQPVERAGGRWQRRDVTCDGRTLDPFEYPLPLTLGSGAGRVCVWENEFVPGGSLTLRKVMLGSTGTVSFAVRPVADPASVLEQAAFVGSEGVPVTARGDDTGRLPAGSYDIEETTAAGSGTWALESVVCNGVPVGSAQGRARVTITAADPDVTCTFTNRYSASAPVTPPSSGGVLGGSESNPAANLRIAKSVREDAVGRGQEADYLITVRNTSPRRARDVVVSDVAPAGLERVRVDAPRGVRCRGSRTLRCVVGTLRGHRGVTLRATYRATRSGRVVNRAAVVTSTAERRLSDNRDTAALRVVGPLACLARVRC